MVASDFKGPCGYGTLEFEGQVPIKPYSYCSSRVFRAFVCITPYGMSVPSHTQSTDSVICIMVCCAIHPRFKNLLLTQRLGRLFTVHLIPPRGSLGTWQFMVITWLFAQAHRIKRWHLPERQRLKCLVYHLVRSDLRAKKCCPFALKLQWVLTVVSR